MASLVGLFGEVRSELSSLRVEVLVRAVDDDGGEEEPW